MSSLTAANSVITLTVPTLLPVPVTLKGFATDDIYSTGEVDSAETMMGVDGTLSGGFVWAPVPITFTFMADSPSIASFEAWDAGQQAATDSFSGQLNITIPGLGKSYQAVTCFLTKTSRLPDAKKLMQPRKFTVTAQQILAIPVGTAG
jgi:hypothetical protein